MANRENSSESLNLSGWDYRKKMSFRPPSESVARPGGGEGTPCSGLYVEAPPQRGAFLCLSILKGREIYCFSLLKGRQNTL